VTGGEIWPEPSRKVVLFDEGKQTFLQTLLYVEIPVESLTCYKSIAPLSTTANPLPNEELLGEFVAMNVLESLRHFATTRCHVEVSSRKLLEVRFHVCCRLIIENFSLRNNLDNSFASSFLLNFPNEEMCNKKINARNREQKLPSALRICSFFSIWLLTQLNHGYFSHRSKAARGGLGVSFLAKKSAS
jgi:hypothetical protein